MVRLENFLKISLQDVLKTSWRHMAKLNILVLTKTFSGDVRLRCTHLSWSRRLEDIFWRRRRKTSLRRLHQDKCLLGYYLEADSHIRKKVKVVLGLPNYANKKELEHTTVVDTSDLDDKKDLIAFKAEVNKLGISKLVNVPNSLNNFYKN